jgi:5'-deoxynucleotidase
MISHFFAYLSKLRWIRRWGLKRNAIAENVMEHSWEVATIAHALALIHNRRCGGAVDANAVAAAALFHDASEVITGDLPTPVKYHNPAITQAYKALERTAEHELLALVPVDLREDYQELLLEERLPESHRALIKAADTLAAYIKCEAELRAGNAEFADAAEDIRARLAALAMPEVEHFLETFLPSYRLTLDQLLNRRPS